MYVALSALGHGPSTGSEAAGERLVVGLVIISSVLEGMGDIDMVEFKVWIVEDPEIDKPLKFKVGAIVDAEI